MNEEVIKPEQKESIKLCKMSKGYNWEIKLLGNPVLDSGVTKMLEDLDKDLRERFLKGGAE